MKLFQVHEVWEVRQDPDELFEWIARELHGLDTVKNISRPGARTLSVSGSFVLGVMWWVVVLLFPLGLLALFARTSYTLQVHADPGKLHVDGACPNPVYEKLRALQAAALAA